MLEHHVAALEYNGIQEAILLLATGLLVPPTSLALTPVYIDPLDYSMGIFEKLHKYMNVDCVCIGTHLLYHHSHLSVLLDHPGSLVMGLSSINTPLFDKSYQSWYAQADDTLQLAQVYKCTEENRGLEVSQQVNPILESGRSLENRGDVSLAQNPGKTNSNAQGISDARKEYHLPLFFKLKRPLSEAFINHYHTTVQYFAESRLGLNPLFQSWGWLFASWLAQNKGLSGVELPKGFVALYTQEQLNNILKFKNPE